MSGAPKISVVMPVFNGEKYLQEALDSIISQTLGNFELVIIDDGSTDGSIEIAQSYRDPRITCFRNETNKGIVSSLNKGIGLARGEYIAIMHADDVSMPQRLELQARFLDAHPEVSMVAVKTSLMDASGKHIGYWSEDHTAATHDEIRNLLPRTNCIAHPSIMIRRHIALSYGYDEKQRATEDYDLWLRLLADDHRIEKLDKILLNYRIHPASITSQTDSDVYKEIRTKARFAMGAVLKGRATSFHRKVLKYLIHDFCRLHCCSLKNKLMGFLRTAFISLGKPLGTMYSRFAPSRHGIVFFFPFPFDHVGGSERVHADIVAANLEKKPWVIIANEWGRGIATRGVDAPCRTSEISPLLRNPFTKHMAIGFFASYINETQMVIFGGNCEFFYWLLPHLSPQVFCTDIIHAYDCIMHEISLPQVMRLNRRLVLADELRMALISLYRQHRVPENCMARIELLDYGVDVPATLPVRRDDILEILYVGRGIEEKRVHLVGRIARTLASRQLPVHISLVGDLIESVAEEDRQFCIFHGVIRDREVINTQYSKADLLVITSSTEGVSLVKMEAMAYGVVPIAVAVGGIPGHIRDGVTGFLVSPDAGEEGIVLQFCDIIERVIKNRDILKKISCNAHDFAKSHFDRSRTLSRFRELLDSQ